MHQGDQLFFRKIEPQDRDLISRGYRALSEDTRWARFLANQASLAAWQLDYLTQADNPDHVAWLAFLQGSGLDNGVKDSQGNYLVGVGRYIKLDIIKAEIAIVVGDQYVRRGIGRKILKKLMESAICNNIEILFGFMSKDNTPMLRLVNRENANISDDHSEFLKFQIIL